MLEVSPDQLQRAVEDLHNCQATLNAVVEVHEQFKGETVWHGVVHVFDISGHPTAKRCYAWSSPIEGSDRRKFYAVLHKPPVTSPVEAVQAAILSDHSQADENKRPNS